MTTLLVDAGNTRIKFGWIDMRNGAREPMALAIGHDGLDRLEDWLGQLPNQPVQALGSNVAGTQAATRIEDFVRRCASLEINWLRSTPQAAGVHNGYMNPAQLGPDRWVSMVGLAARGRDERPMLLASFGTTTTIDTLSFEQNGPTFVGGLILPGPMLMRASVASATANLPLAESSFAAFPLHTHQAISSGIAAAQAGALLRQWRECLARFRAPPHVYCSGGGWPMVEDEVQRMLARAQNDGGLPTQAARYIESPVLDGLARLASA